MRGRGGSPLPASQLNKSQDRRRARISVSVPNDICETVANVVLVPVDLCLREFLHHDFCLSITTFSLSLGLDAFVLQV